MEKIIEIVGYLVTAFAGTFFGWLFGRKKYNAEVEGTKVQNFDAAIEAYKKMYEDMIADPDNPLDGPEGYAKRKLWNWQHNLVINLRDNYKFAGVTFSDFWEYTHLHILEHQEK